MKALHSFFLMGQNTAIKASGIEPLLLAGANTQILVCHIANGLTVTINTVAIFGPLQGHRPYGGNNSVMPSTGGTNTQW